MCIICVELANQRMTELEAYRALKEYDDTTDEAKEHKSEILAELHKRLAEKLAKRV